MVICRFLVLSLLFLSTKSQTETDEDGDISGRPWQNPLQELESITASCTVKIPGFDDIASVEQSAWQSCIDSITLPVANKFPVLETQHTVQEDKINSSVIHELDRELHMVICRNTTAYKSCWLGIIDVLNKCSPERGDVAGKLYFALYDDICQDEGRLAVENRRKASMEGELCDRNYSIDECTTHVEDMNSINLCLRFQSNALCDVKSIDPNCQNKIDKGMHAEIFQRVEKVLGCQTSNSTSTWDTSASNSLHVTGISISLLLLIAFEHFLL